ncbi:MAG TPA: M24 family metallopeptidase, partial [Woeseiaceae bacterium]|nr:M24 family metallopeptidase [Woeseiaceae bacterium]
MNCRLTPALPCLIGWSRTSAVLLWLTQLLLAQPLLAHDLANEARLRWETQCQIRKEKFDLVLPRAMRDNGIDMWIVMIKEGLQDPLYEDLGRGFTGSKGFYIFTDRGGERIERSVFGIYGPMLEQCEVYDRIESNYDLRAFIAERDPQKIGVDISEQLGVADGLSHSSYTYLVETLGEPYASRLTSAEKLVSDFRSHRVAGEIAAFAETAELTRRIIEKALSNEVISPGVTTLGDVAWWMQNEILKRGMQSRYRMSSVYVTGPSGIEATSNDRIIHRGDLVMSDFGLGHLNFFTDIKRMAYVLEEGETGPPKAFQEAFRIAEDARRIMKETIKPGRTARETLEMLNRKYRDAGFAIMETFNQPADNDETEIIVATHSVGNLHHGAGPSLAWFNPLQQQWMIEPTNLFSIELFVWYPVPQWDGAKVRIPLEDNAVVTDRGVEWLYPVAERILLIK